MVPKGTPICEWCGHIGTFSKCDCSKTFKRKKDGSIQVRYVEPKYEMNDARRILSISHGYP